jgi:molecular chaperone DnaK (HSP70)
MKHFLSILPIIMLSVMALGCHSQSRQPLVVEDNTQIIGAGGTATEALGIETLGGVFTPLIKPGTKVPCSVSEVFSTAADGQTRVMIILVRGTNQMAASNHALGRFQVVGIPPAPRGMPKVEVTFAITQHQILISARDLTRDTEMEIRGVAKDTEP